MKKYFFGAIIALSLTAMSAKPNVKQCEMSNAAAENQDCCACAAWDFGTFMGGGDHDNEYFWTDMYYTYFCE